MDSALANLHEVTVPGEVTATRCRPPTVPDHVPDFVQKVTRLLMDGQGDKLPVSAFPVDGTWLTGTSQYEKRSIAQEIPIWESDICVQCNFCAMICPHTAIVSKVFEPEAAKGAPDTFEAVPETHTPELEGLDYRLQVAPEDCTGCGLCVEVCPAKDRTQPKRKAINMQPLLIPLFEYSGACAGCGETPYEDMKSSLPPELYRDLTGPCATLDETAMAAHHFIDSRINMDAEARSFFPESEVFEMGSSSYLKRLEQLQSSLDVPVVASLNGVSPGGWTHHARELEDAGASAIELNLYDLATDPSDTAATLEAAGARGLVLFNRFY
jgi:ferredoxin